MTKSPQVADFLRSHVAQVVPLEAAACEAAWDLATATGGDVERLAKTSSDLRHLYGDEADRLHLEELLKTPGHSAIERRQLELLNQRYASQRMTPELRQAISGLEARIEELYSQFRPELDGEPIGNNDIKDILSESRDLQERQEAWEASKRVGDAVSSLVLELVALRNEAARAQGYRDYVAMSLAQQELDEAHIMGLLDSLEAVTQGPFEAMKGELDAHLRARFDLGEGVPLKPWHYGDPFFQARPTLPGDFPLDDHLSQWDPEEIVPPFFEAIGLEVAEILQRSDLRERQGKSQHAFCARMNREGDVRVLVNLRPGEGWTSTFLHELGHAVYDDNHPEELPWMLRDVSHPLTTEGIALFCERLSRDPHWLRRYTTLEGDALAHAQATLPRMLQQDRLVFTRWSLVMVHFERALYADPSQDLNRVWWELVERLQGVSAPTGREGHSDWAAKIHLATAPVYYQNYPLGDLIASHLHHHLVTSVLGGDKGRDPKEALISDPKVGAYLRDVFFSFGATLPWQEHIEAATGEALSPEHFADLLRG